jgi:hypothetical protein
MFCLDLDHVQITIEIYGHRAGMRAKLKSLGWCGSGRVREKRTCLIWSLSERKGEINLQKPPSSLFSCHVTEEGVTEAVSALLPMPPTAISTEYSVIVCVLCIEWKISRRSGC